MFVKELDMLPLWLLDSKMVARRWMEDRMRSCETALMIAWTYSSGCGGGRSLLTACLNL